ncbi:MAG: InlB B-repeat-containing protein [Clostridia bacterium]|nr:InlB B-repeat-containing protein [Clostridia bacterium]
MRMMKKLVSLTMALMLLCSLFAVAAPTAVTVSALAGASKYGDGQIFAWGCDMSQWNVNGATYTDYSLVDFKKMKADGCDFVILRIGDEKADCNGVRRADPTFPTLYKMAREAGLHIGAYYYSFKTTRAGAVGDAQFCLDIIEKNDMYFEYPIYFDIEAEKHWSLSDATKVDICLGWCETMEAAGYYPGVYSNAGCALDALQASSKFNYDTWIPKPKQQQSGAQYDPNTDYVSFRSQYGMWQYKFYSESWSAPSYEGSYWYDSTKGWPLDCNVAFRDYPTIMATYGYNNVVKKHTVNFESNGGSAVESVKVKDGDKLTAPTAPTKYAFEFGGWYCNPELTDPYDFNTPVPYDFTLYAKWNEATWGAQTNLMPNSVQMQLNDFNGQGAIWPYWNDDAYGSVTMYNGVTTTDNWSWPSAYMEYENSFDSSNDSYIYVKKDGTAQFNVVLTYLDKNGEAHDLYLSEVAGIGGTDFPAGPMEAQYDVGSYIRGLGHTPASGNVKFTRVTYYCIGEKDSYVKLYDLKLTPKVTLADPYKTMMTHDITQLSGLGSYTYNDGTLTMNATAADGYSVKMNVNGTIDPSDMTKLLMDVNATVPFNVTLELTNGNGDATMEFRNEFFNVFDLTTAPEALPAGAWKPVLNLVGYYEWNGGAVTESAIKSVTVSLTAPGTLTMTALQASRLDTVNYVHDGATSAGSLEDTPEPPPVDDKIEGDLNGDGEVTTSDARLILREMLVNGTLTAEQLALADLNGDGEVTTADARVILLGLIG